MGSEGAGGTPAPSASPGAPMAQPAAARQEVFAYACNRCSRRCRRKLIQANPYEMARLARVAGA